MDLQRQYLYKISRSGTYLGILPNVTSDFAISQSIGRAGAQLPITLELNADTAHDDVLPLQDEAGNIITDENNEPIYADRAAEVIGSDNPNALVQNNNDIEVWEFDTNAPDGRLVFSGFISRWSAKFGKNEMKVNVVCINYGSELDNYLVTGGQSADVTQSSENTTVVIADYTSGNYVRAGQNFLVTAGITHLDAITLKLSKVSLTGLVTVTVYASVVSANSGGTPLGTATRVVDASSPTDYKFTFAAPIPVTDGPNYFFTVSSDEDFFGHNLRYQNTNVYSGGSRYTATFSGGAGTYLQATGTDLYFITHYSGGVVDNAFTATDPSVILTTILDAYISAGGHVTHNANSIDATGLSVDHTFRTNTVLEAISVCLDLAPWNWYWFVDPADNVLYFKQTSAVAEHRFILGNHINELDVEAKVEDVKNVVYFTGGDTGAGVNLFISVTDQEAIAANTGRVGLAFLTNNRVVVEAEAIVIAQSFLDANNSESYETTVDINADKYDVSTIRIGQVIGFAGFGNMVDNLLLQVVALTRTPDSVTLTLGKIPKRASALTEELERRLTLVETVDNPSAPN